MKPGNDTKTQDEPGNEVGEGCPECGMEKQDWPQAKGVRKEGEVYCCDGCAEGTGCTCEEPAE